MVVLGAKFVCACDEGYAVNPMHQEQCLQQLQYLKMMGWNAVAKASSMSWRMVAGILVGSTLLALLAGVALHKWRLQRTMQTEIHAIMRQYMPLEGNNYPEGELAAVDSSKDRIKAQLGDEQC